METQTEHREMKKNTVVSTLSLFFQSGYAAVLGLVANLILTIQLGVGTFGVYILTLSVISFFNYFSDIGLAASLVQKKEVSDDDLRTTFTVQQFLVITIIILGFLATPLIKEFYSLPPEASYLYWALLGSFFLSSLKTIPSIQLERTIQFQKIVLVQMVENTVFYTTVAVLALANFGLLSFTIAVVIRALTGTTLIYYLSFWSPRIGISKKSLRTLLAFGLPFQLNTFLALIKDDLIMLYLGKALGIEGIAYIGWAKKWAEAPIRIIMDNISRVLFPVLSRLRHDKDTVAALVEKILNYQTKLLAPTLLGLALCMSLFVELIPKYNKWDPALPLFYLFTVSAFFASYSTPFINLFNAFGKVKISFYFMLGWTTASWILTVLLTERYGYFGFPLAQVALAGTCIFVIFMAKSFIHFRFLKSIVSSLIASLLMGVIVYGILSILDISYTSLILAVIAGIASYFLIHLVVFRTNLIIEVRRLFSHD